MSTTLFVATEEELSHLEPVEDIRGGSLVPPIVDPPDDWARFLEEHAPARLRALPHVVGLPMEPSSLERLSRALVTPSHVAPPIVARDPVDAAPDDPPMALRGLWHMGDAAVAALADLEDQELVDVAERASLSQDLVVVVRKLARVATHRGGHVLLMTDAS